jgi:DNA repair protein RecO (recombination protein O)
MLEKTSGIILNKIKYTDSGIVAQLYTKKFGRLSLLVRGMHNKKTGKHSSLFQPLFILDLEIYFKPCRDMQALKDFSVIFSPYNIYTDIRKSTVAIFLGEVLTSVLREESPSEELYNYIESSIMYFDRCHEDFVNFHIAFLAGLSSFLGFEPSPGSSSGDVFFDIRNGTFIPIPPFHGNYVTKEISSILAMFFRASYDTAGKIALTGKERNEVLDTLLRYYSFHLPGLKKINSLKILKEVFE